MGSIGMVINTAKEGCCCVLSDHLNDEMRSSGMLVDESSDIMNEARDENEVTFLGLLLD